MAKNKNLCIRVSEETRVQLDKIVETERRSISNSIEIAIDKYYKELFGNVK